MELLRRREDLYATAKGTPEDVLLLIEVSDSSLDFDHNVKLPIYAEGSIEELWIVNLIDDCVEAYQQPHGHTYDRVRVLRRGGQLEITALPELPARWPTSWGRYRRKDRDKTIRRDARGEGFGV